MARNSTTSSISSQTLSLCSTRMNNFKKFERVLEFYHILNFLYHLPFVVYGSSDIIIIIIISSSSK